MYMTEILHLVSARFENIQACQYINLSTEYRVLNSL